MRFCAQCHLLAHFVPKTCPHVDLCPHTQAEQHWRAEWTQRVAKAPADVVRSLAQHAQAHLSWEEKRALLLDHDLSSAAEESDGSTSDSSDSDGTPDVRVDATLVLIQFVSTHSVVSTQTVSTPKPNPKWVKSRTARSGWKGVTKESSNIWRSKPWRAKVSRISVWGLVRRRVDTGGKHFLS